MSAYDKLPAEIREYLAEHPSGTDLTFGALLPD
jgi:hypothetical protein